MSKKKTIIVIQRRDTRTHRWEDEQTFEDDQVAEVGKTLNELKKKYPGITFHVIQRRVRND